MDEAEVLVSPRNMLLHEPLHRSCQQSDDLNVQNSTSTSAALARSLDPCYVTDTLHLLQHVYLSR